MDLFAGRADRVLVGITVGNPHLAAERLYRHTFDIRSNDVRLADVVGESIVVPVAGVDGGAFVCPGLGHNAIVPLPVAGGDVSDDNQPMSEELDQARAKLNKEFEQVSEDIATVHIAFHELKEAGPESDIYGLLDALETAVKRARKGGLVGSGAKGHRKALEAYRELLNPPASAQ